MRRKPEGRLTDAELASIAEFYSRAGQNRMVASALRELQQTRAGLAAAREALRVAGEALAFYADGDYARCGREGYGLSEAEEDGGDVARAALQQLAGRAANGEGDGNGG